MIWTTETINNTTDSNTAKRAREIALGNKLKNIQKNDLFIWGECKGSGASSYQIVVDLADGAVNCNCPVRGNCKHGLGLLLRFAEKGDTFEKTENIVEWAKVWIDKRLKKAEPKVEKPKTAAEIEKTEKKKEQNAVEKMEGFQQNLQDLSLWMQDLVRTGVASQAESEKLYAWGWLQSTWMNDSKAQGISSFIKSLAIILNKQNANWAEEFVMELGELFMFVKSYQNLEKLPENIQTEFKNIAFYTKEKEIIANYSAEAIEDEWIITGQNRFEVDDNLPEGWNPSQLVGRRIWAHGIHTGKNAYFLDFYYNGNFGSARPNFDYHLNTGTIVKGKVLYYPSLTPSRAFLLDKGMSLNVTENEGKVPHFQTIEENLQSIATAISLNPWTRLFPFLLKNVRLVQINKQWAVVDENRFTLSFSISNEHLYKIFAVTGNQPFHLTGEWNGKAFSPCTIWIEGRFYAI